MTSDTRVLFPDPLVPTSAVVVPAGASNEMSRKDGRARVVAEGHVLEPHVADDVARRCAVGVVGVLGHPRPQFANPVEPGERFGDLGADRRDLDQRQRHQASERDVLNELADRHAAGEDVVPPTTMSTIADQPDDHRRHRRRAEMPVIVAATLRKSLLAPSGERQLLAPLGGIGLHDANPRDAFHQASGDFGVELAAQRGRSGAAWRRRTPCPPRNRPAGPWCHGGQSPVDRDEHRRRRRVAVSDPADELHQTRFR